MARPWINFTIGRLMIAIAGCAVVLALSQTPTALAALTIPTGLAAAVVGLERLTAMPRIQAAAWVAAVYPITPIPLALVAAVIGPIGLIAGNFGPIEFLRELFIMMVFSDIFVCPIGFFLVVLSEPADTGQQASGRFWLFGTFMTCTTVAFLLFVTLH